MSRSNEILNQYQDNLIKNNTSNLSNANDDSEKEDWDDQDFLDLLEEDDDSITKYREQRVQELSQQMKDSRDHVDRAQVQTLTSEAELFELTTTTGASAGYLKNQKGRAGSGKNANVPAVVVHFFHPEFQTCKLMDARLQELARRHFNTTRFVRISAADAPFLTARLNIQVLPCVIGYVNGVERKRLLGFEELGNDPNKLDLQVLESALLQSGVLDRIATAGGKKNGGILGFQQTSSIRGAKKPSYDDDDDWD